MPRRNALATATIVAALAATTGATPALARPADNRAPLTRDHPPTQITVTRPAGFAWPEALLGAGTGALLITLAAAGADLRRRATTPAERGTRR